MNKSLLRLGLLLGLLTGCKTGPAASSNRVLVSKPNYVLVHGAWGGGWDWRHVDDLLTADGNKVFRASLTGQGERVHLATTNIDLDTHIQDVVNMIVWENLHDVVLMGHSYGGMVITGVADPPERIQALVYVDAILPENGENANQVMGRHGGNTTNDFMLPTWVKGNPPAPHDVPMPAKTFSEPIVLTNQPAALKISTFYLLAIDPGKTAEQDAFYKSYQRAQARGWVTWTMESDHNVQRSHPVELVKLLETAGK